MDFLPAWVSDLSGWGVVALMALSLLTGKGGLATRREVDAEKARADKFQHAWEVLMKAREEEGAQKQELMQGARLTARVMETLQKQARRYPDPEGDTS